MADQSGLFDDSTVSSFVSLLSDTESGECSLSSPSASSHCSTGESDTGETESSSPGNASTSAPTSSKVPLPKLPPCRVCGESASGLHYGVNTCEACKGFFRRSLLRKVKYKCNCSGECVIEPGKRNFCAYCRHKKCISLGMSKTAIKTGRYTHAKRTKDIQEVKCLERQQKSGSGSDDHYDKESFRRELMLALGEFRKTSPFYPSEVLEKLEEKQNKYLNEYEYNRSLFGLEKDVSMTEYKDLFQKTGIDVDGRRHLAMFVCLPHAEAAVRRYIRFVKAIPGFKELLMEDQIALIKAARFEVLLLGAHKGFHPTNDILTGSSGGSHHIDELSKIYSNEFMKCCFQLARRLQLLNVTDTELILMQVIVLFFTDRCPLKHPDSVEKMQSRVVDVLQSEIEQNQSQNKRRLASLLNYLSDLRIGTEMYTGQVGKTRVILTDLDVQVPPLLVEMCAH